MIAFEEKAARLRLRRFLLSGGTLIGVASMAHEEGFRRLKMIARIVVLAGLSFIVSASTTYLLSVFLRISTSSFSVLLFLSGLYLSLIGGFLRLVLWVVEGFLYGPKATQR